ncbi:aminobenzoyl-glutamate transporter [Halobacillus halophilus]|uniref:AbgT family protein n=1 Tax=Halobacillus halophilus (strain ATCC 35676 / DSM 2266 / JCM 20832 / KCTC 3685 / LMG 17431 / NBRC 102448 / NCIMB 2269) TaxID=866895 RepID=I0JTJ7_HALH3|nr:AbgT family transporter [Halobacillus halophilus]ASF41377.1 aminobenzoyl-glutamate transporter [Halobacillus halophilus]CCG47470.1 AbgT family protein [Halobacillus halophilus DSM 2266]
MSEKKATPSSPRRFLFRILDGIEWLGNKLPSPLLLFAILALIVVIISGIFSSVSVTNPTSGEVIQVKNLFSLSGLDYIFNSAVENFIGFPPLGAVLVTMLGIGLAEQTGLINSSLKGIVFSFPNRLLTAALVFAGVMSSVAVNAGYVVLPPLGAVLFLGLGRHPLAGLAAAFAGVSGGFGANPALTSTDAVLQELTVEATRTLDPAYAETITVTMNYFFAAVSVLLVTIVGTLVTDKIVEPRLGRYEGGENGEIDELTSLEKRGMRLAGIGFLFTFLLMAYLSFGPLRGDGAYIDSPFFNALVFVIFILFLVPGLIYGIVVKEIKNDKDLTKLLGKTMASMSGYIALAFTAGQFIAYFRETNLGTVIAFKGADFLNSTGFDGIGLILTFLGLTMVVNFFIGSSSAKWTILAPVFVPIMMNLGYSPEFTTLLYRIADSVTNMITPLLLYFPVIIAFAQRYDKKLGIGTLISMMIPYSVAFLLAWLVMLLVWVLLGIPVGPGAPISY